MSTEDEVRELRERVGQLEYQVVEWANADVHAALSRPASESTPVKART